MIGMCITKNDPGIIKVLLKVVPLIDSLYVLDGGDKKELREFVEKLKIPHLYITDHEAGENFPRNGLIKEPLLEEIKKSEQLGEWVYIIHGDEIPIDNPLAVARRAEDFFADAIEWNIVNYFYHPSDNRLNLRKELSRIHSNNLKFNDFKWYFLPAWKRVRMFRLDTRYSFSNKFPQRDFPVGGMKTKPKIFHSNAIIKHYPFYGTLRELIARQHAALIGTRFKSIAFSWLAAYGSIEVDELFLSVIPKVPGLIDNAVIFNENKFPLPITYR